MATDPTTAPSGPSRRVAPFDAAAHVEAETQIDIRPATSHAPELSEVPGQGVDLAGRCKIIMAAGRGKTGKTTLLRWIAERALLADRPHLMADVDPTNASFASYFDGVSRPETDSPAKVSRWLQRFIEYAVTHQTTALIDLGGGDTVLRSLASEMPGFAEQIVEAGATPVIFYLAGAQPDDLAPIATLASRGFMPPARAIVFNESSIDPGLSRAEAFVPVLRSAVVLDQLRREAITLWMPRLYAASAVESRRALFAAARDGHTTPPLGLFDRSRVRVWLDAMDQAFSGVATWMP
jgi:hypothetical protein